MFREEGKSASHCNMSTESESRDPNPSSCPPSKLPAERQTSLERTSEEEIQQRGNGEELASHSRENSEQSTGMGHSQEAGGGQDHSHRVGRIGRKLSGGAEWGLGRETTTGECSSEADLDKSLSLLVPAENSEVSGGIHNCWVRHRLRECL